MFDGKVQDPKTMPMFLMESMIFGISGLALGSFVDTKFKKLSERYPNHRYAIATLQLFILILIVAVMYTFFKNDFVLHFQQTMPGMAFPAMYFGVQNNIFDAGHALFA